MYCTLTHKSNQCEALEITNTEKITFPQQYWARTTVYKPTIKELCFTT